MSSVAVAGIAGLAPTLAILVSYVLSRRDSNRAAKKVAREVATVKATVADTAHDANEKLETIHTLVNSRLTEALQRIDDLEQRLIAANEPLPPPGRG